MPMADKFVEYNMINNISILCPFSQNRLFSNLMFAPRYTIADADKILHCFDANKREFFIQNAPFRYVKVPLNKSFATLNNEVTALYFYVMVENTIDYDAFDFKNPLKVIRWLKTGNNRFVLVTTPVLRYQNTLYTIANDNRLSVLEHKNNELQDDNRMLSKLIQGNCYTICDNYNIIISLYQKQLIDRDMFKTMIDLLNYMKSFDYTPDVWMQLLNQHRILSACDFPVLHLCTTPDLVCDEDILTLFHNDIFDTYRRNSVYMQASYKKQILFTSFISASYPCANVQFMKIIFGKNIADGLWFNMSSLPKEYWIFAKSSMFVNDFYGLFASFAYNDDMWCYWCENRIQLLSKLISYNSNNFVCILFDILCPLFRLYDVGYEGIKIKKRRIRLMWKDVLFQYKKDVRLSNEIISDIFKCLALLNNKIQVPYNFILDVYHIYDIDFGKNRIALYDSQSNKLVKNVAYKQTSIYNILRQRVAQVYPDSFHFFYNNVIKKRSKLILLYLYKKFGMLSTSDDNIHMLVGHLLVNYLRENMYYLC
jgi:hypothetical protein